MPHHPHVEVVSFLGRNYPAHTWDMGLAVIAMILFLAIYYGMDMMSDE